MRKTSENTGSKITAAMQVIKTMAALCFPGWCRVVEIQLNRLLCAYSSINKFCVCFETDRFIHADFSSWLRTDLASAVSGGTRTRVE